MTLIGFALFKFLFYFQSYFKIGYSYSDRHLLTVYVYVPKSLIANRN